jgi:hypothetical protein
LSLTLKIYDTILFFKRPDLSELQPEFFATLGPRSEFPYYSKQCVTHIGNLGTGSSGGE